MSAPPPPTIFEKVIGLLFMTGFMMAISALPVGIVLALLEHSKRDADWRCSIATGAVITIVIIVVGCGLLGVASLGRRRL